MVFGKKKKKKKKKLKNIETVISSGTKIEGTIEVEESIRIDGELRGKLVAQGDIFVGETGKLKADVEGDDVMIAGKVEGNVKAEGKLEIVDTAKLVGDICISNLVIHDGAIFKGRSTSKFAIEDSKQDNKQKTDDNSKNKKSK